MHRSLAGLVPHEVLSRKTKQFAARTPVVALERKLEELLETFNQPLSSQFGYIDRSCFTKAMNAARAGHSIHTVRLLTTISLDMATRFGRAEPNFSTRDCTQCACR